MEKYESYDIGAFFCDDLFIDWVISPNPYSEKYWNEVFARYPMIRADAEEAKRMLLNIRIQPDKTMPAHIRQEITANVLAIVNSKSSDTARKHFIFSFRHVRRLAAACSFVFIGVALYFYPYSPSPEQPADDLVFLSPADNTTREIAVNTSDTPLLLIMPDNSTIVLEPKSSISYDTISFIEDREVDLVGGAFFEVQHQGNSPFVVKTTYLKTTVLGTSFRIEAFDEDGGHRVSVNTGLVQVQTNGNKSVAEGGAVKNTVYVNANQEALYDVAGIRLSQMDIPEDAIRKKTPLSKEALETQFDFQSTPLEIILNTLSEKYNITIQLDDPALASRTITASLRDMYLYDKLKLVSKAAEATYRIEDGRIKFKSIDYIN